MRTILWDMDGTIADTEGHHFAAWHVTMTELGIAYDYDAFLADFGKNNREILRRELGAEAPPPRIRAISRNKEAAFRARLVQEPAQLMPGIAQWLERMEEAGVQQVISSSGTMANIVALVHALGIGGYFHSIMSGYALPQGKPHPALFLKSAAAVGATPAQCIVIEDSLSGIEAARRAGMASIAVGKLAHSAQLAQLLARVEGPACLSTTTLEDVQWQDFEALWAAHQAEDGEAGSEGHSGEGHSEGNQKANREGSHTENHTNQIEELRIIESL